MVESQGVTLLTELEWQYGTLVDRDQEEVHRPREVELSTILRSFTVLGEGPYSLLGLSPS